MVHDVFETPIFIDSHLPEGAEPKHVGLFARLSPRLLGVDPFLKGVGFDLVNVDAHAAIAEFLEYAFHFVTTPR
jgi:hypothetical protein